MSLKKKFLKSKPVCKVTFRLPKSAANEAKKVVVLGDFNDWDKENGHTMRKTKEYFTVTIDLETNREYQFRYLLDGEVWENDWEADAYVKSPLGVENSVVSTKEE